MDRGPNAKIISAIAQLQNEKIMKKEKPIPIPQKYLVLIGQFPGLQETDFRTPTAKHGVIHEIDTGNHPPCQAKARHLMPGSQRAIKSEKAWE